MKSLLRLLLFVIVLATGCAPRTVAPGQGGPPLWRPANGNVVDYGATGNDDTDDSAAFQAALDAVIAAGGGVLYIPAGDYRLEKIVAADMTDIGLTIRGDGQGVSNIHCDNADGVFRLRDDWCKWHVNIRDLALLADRADAGTAIEVTSPHRGDRKFRTLTVENVEIRGAGIPSGFYFNRGIKAIYQWRPLFRNVIFCGVWDPRLKKKRSDKSPLYRPSCGFQADWCYAPSFQHCYSWSVHTGYRIVSEGRSQGPEDSAFYRCFAVECRVGIDIQTPIPEPQLVIDSCHINARDIGIRLKNRKFFQIVNNLMYGNDRNSGRPYTDIELAGKTFAGVFSGNIFHSPDPQNYKPEPVIDRTMFRLGPDCRNLTFTSNIFNAKGTAFAVDPAAQGIVRANNQYMNRQTVVPADAH